MLISFAAGTVPLSAGGDHLITLPILRAIATKGPLGLVHFDAHSDTWDTYFGAPITHGTPFRRASEEGLIDQVHDAVVDNGVLDILSSDYIPFSLMQAVFALTRGALPDLLGAGRTTTSSSLRTSRSASRSTWSADASGSRMSRLIVRLPVSRTIASGLISTPARSSAKSAAKRDTALTARATASTSPRALSCSATRRASASSYLTLASGARNPAARLAYWRREGT